MTFFLIDENVLFRSESVLRILYHIYSRVIIARAIYVFPHACRYIYISKSKVVTAR